MYNIGTQIDKGFCLSECWKHLKPECLGVCSLDTYGLFFMFVVFSLSLVMKYVIVNKLSNHVTEKGEPFYNVLLMIQFVLMVFSVIFIIITIKHKYLS